MQQVLEQIVVHAEPKLVRLSMTIKSLPQNNKRKRSRPDRIGELAVLPVFYKLKDKKVVLAGGSDAAAWKCELLISAGAIVHLYACELDSEFDALIADNPKQIIWHKRPWAIDIFENAQIAIGDMESDSAAKAFYCAAKASGVAVNVIDMPDYCEFQFGSIVNRSPAIVSISTDGAAPILGQAIRRRIETLLPTSLQGWAQTAMSIRARVNELLEPGKERRAFWEHFVDLAFSKKVEPSTETQLLKSAKRLKAAQDTGKVTLVGAGPGDAELLTIKAMRALQSADVILFDDLVSSDVLELARREAKRMLVGKRGGRESCKQDDINNMMLQFAKSGKNVVRLKSGDPSVFGRAGEEICALEKHNIPVSIIPGITAASAMAAQLGVSLTHRNHAQSVRFITGHSKHGKLPESVNWQAVADQTTTTIFYMGGRTATQIKARLLEEGMTGQMPVVISSSISRDNQETWFGALNDLEIGIAQIGYDEPVLIGVGHVFADMGAEQIIPQPFEQITKLA
jgi:uroporphyrin-III C-methyltransferase/precorrin-2 dehydrogenase/sirohydrochlorin ferrochelatase